MLLEKEKNYYVYCRSGIRSVTACKILESAGVEITFNLLGGILDWAGDKVSPD
jgi:rhodanese-related sulfurtransferase